MLKLRMHSSCYLQYKNYVRALALTRIPSICVCGIQVQGTDFMSSSLSTIPVETLTVIANMEFELQSSMDINTYRFVAISRGDLTVGKLKEAFRTEAGIEITTTIPDSELLTNVLTDDCNIMVRYGIDKLSKAEIVNESSCGAGWVVRDTSHYLTKPLIIEDLEVEYGYNYFQVSGLTDSESSYLGALLSQPTTL